MKQKFTKVALLAMLLIMSFNAYAYDFEADGLYYTITSTSDLTCKVVKGDIEYSGDIVIPSEVQYLGKTLKVTDIGSTFKGSEISSIICPAEALTASSFSDCTKLERIELNGQISILPELCFYNCQLLNECKFPSTIIEVGNACFYNCISLKNIPSGIQVLGEGAFENCSSLEEIDLSEIKSEIPKSAFQECIKLRSVQLPKNFETIGENAFYNCKNLSSLEFPEGVETISDKAFYGCEKINSIELPKSLKNLGSYVFEGTKIETIELPNGVTNFSPACFLESKVKSLTIGEGIDMFPVSFSYGGNETLYITDMYNHYKADGFYKEYKRSEKVSEDDYKIIFNNYNYAKINYKINVNNSWQSLRNLIIADSENAFNYSTAIFPFSGKDLWGSKDKIMFLNCAQNLDYYYIGRPLKTGGNLQSIFFYEWDSNYGGTTTCFYREHLLYYTLMSMSKLENGFSNKNLQFPNTIKKLEFGGFCENAYIDYIMSTEIDSLKINSSVSLLSINAEQLNNMKKIEMRASVPPSLIISSIYNKVSTETYTKLEIEVPKGCLEAYQTAPVWNKFWNIKEGDYDGQSGVVDVEIQKPSKYETARFDINGVPVSRDHRGLIIIKYSDGSSEKMFLK